MDPAPLKLHADLAAVITMAKLSPHALAPAAGATAVPTAIERLEQAGAAETALHLYAYALPPREAVWWASMCAAATSPPHQPATERQAREAAEHWVRRQDEAARRAAMVAARQAGFRAAESFAAMGAFWSGGSLAPEGQAAVAPAPHLTGKAVHGAVTLAAVRNNPRLRAHRIARFLVSARDIAAGGGGPVAPDPA